MLKRVAIVTGLATVAVFGLLLSVLPTPGKVPSPADAPVPFTGNSVVLEQVRVFDGQSLSEPTTLTIVDGRIAGIGADTRMPMDVPVLDGSGKTVLPGLIDAHTHTFGSARRDALRFGVTTMLDMFTAPATIAGMATARDSDARTDQAALFSAGMLATVDGGHGTQFGVNVDTLSGPDEAPAWVAARKAEGSDYIKLAYIPDADTLPSLDLPTATAVIEAAHAQGLLAVAHIGTAAAATDMVRAGIDGLVHVFADEPASAALVEAIRRSGVFVIPTLAVIATADGRAPGKELLIDADVAPLLTDAQKSSLAGSYGEAIAGFSLAVALDNVRRLHAAGVPILAGSDAPNPGTAHGATLHQELELLARAGLSASDALRAATSVPATRFKLDGRGVIEAGARADLVLIDGDPLTELPATRRIHSVLRNGYVVERAARGGRRDRPLRRLPGTLGTFDAGLDAADGLAWSSTSDEVMGGASTAALSHVERDQSGGAMRVAATVAEGFAYPWAGAYLAVTPAGDAASLAGYSAIEFDVRGTPARYRLMLFGADPTGAPPTATFEVGARWSRVSIPLTEFGAATSAPLTGLAIVTPTATGDYEFVLDDLRLVE